jgi:hypothetical protein
VSVTPESISAVLEPLRQGFQADGADLAIDEANDAEVKVRLIVTEDTCLDCIMPTDFLTRILESTVRDTFPEIGNFAFVDPRE